MQEEKTYTQMRQEFQEKFFKELSPALKKYDAEWRKKSLQAILSASFFSALGILSLYAIFATKLSSFILVAIIMFSTAGCFCYVIKKCFEDEIKDKIMPLVCKCCGNINWLNGVFYNIYKDSKAFEESNLIPSLSLRTVDDYFSGSYKDIGFEIIECTANSGKNRKAVFVGAIVKLDMNKRFQGNTVIQPDSMFHTSPSSRLVHTTLEDVEFEKKFDVYTDDEVEARYLITPSFMERLNNMKVAFNADAVSCAFYEKYLFVALHTRKDLFSICSLLKPVNDGKQFFQMFEEILSIIKLIDHFKLDQKIGL